MYKVMSFLMLSILISALLMMLCLIISKKNYMNREKMSPFECGFDPKSSPRSPFSSQFFLIAVLFLVFDVEIVIIMPLIVTLKVMKMMSWMITSSIMIIILMAGLYHEWKNGILEWAK